MSRTRLYLYPGESFNRRDIERTRRTRSVSFIGSLGTFSSKGQFNLGMIGIIERTVRSRRCPELIGYSVGSRVRFPVTKVDDVLPLNKSLRSGFKIRIVRKREDEGEN
jgi:hypothetical protein